MKGISKIGLFALWILLNSVSLVAQDCNIVSKANDITPDRLCAPVNVNWDVTYRGVNNVGTSVQVEFNWDDGNAPQRINAILLNAVTSEWKAIHNHTYPVGGNRCNYRPTATLVVNGVLCTSSLQEQIVTVWDTDDKNGGNIVINPTIYPICFGNDGTVIFHDLSLWNCTPPIENDVINNRKRWIQWIYGTSGNILLAEIGGVVRAWPFIDAIHVTPEPITAPMAPWNTSMPVYVPLGYNVGDYIEVTIRNWNYCNPYDDPNIPGPPVDLVNGDFPPETTTAQARIVALPDPGINAAGPYCSNAAAVTLTAVTPGGTWSGTGITNTSTGRFSPSTAGAGLHPIHYSLTDGNGCCATGNRSVRIHPTPQVNIIPGVITNLCPGSLLTIDGNPSGGTMPYTHLWTGSTANLSNNTIQNPQFSSTVVGTYNLTYKVTDINLCNAQANVSVVVEPIDISFANKNLSVCHGSSVVFQPNPTGGSMVFIEHKWTGLRTDLLDSTTIENPVFNASEVGSFKYYYYVKGSQGCEAIDSLVVTVYEMPVAILGNDTTVCESNMNLVASVGVGSKTWSKVSGLGVAMFSNPTNPSTNVSVNAFGVYEFEWKLDNAGCTSRDTIKIIFAETPAPTVGPDDGVCAKSYRLVATPHLGGGSWSAALGNPGNAVFSTPNSNTSTVTVDTTGIFKFVYSEINAGACIGSDTIAIHFFPIPKAQVLPFNTLSCNPYSMSIVNSSINSTLYNWDFGDGYNASTTDVTHVYENLSPTVRDFQLQMVASNSFGCSDTLRKTINVAPSPRVRFKATPSSGCSPLISVFTNQSVGAVTYEWDFDDKGAGSYAVDTSYTFVNNEFFVVSHDVVLIGNNSYGCADTAQAFVTVYPLRDIPIAASPTEGCSPLKVDFTSEAGAYNYQWNFGDGIQINALNDVSHWFSNNTVDVDTFNVRLISSTFFGCRDTSFTSIRVLPSPKALLILDPVQSCSPHNVGIVNSSTLAIKSTLKIDAFPTIDVTGAGTLNQVFINNGFVPDWHTIGLKVESSMGCRDSVEKSIQTFPKVLASIGDIPDGCSPYLVNIPNYSVGANSFIWNFGDGYVSTGYAGKHTYLNTSLLGETFNLTMVAKSAYGCSDTARSNVIVYPVPKPQFVATPLIQNMPLSSVDLVNQTPGDNWTYLWHFGDGVSSVDKNANHNYGQSGEFRIWLKAMAHGCVDSISQRIRILPMMPFIDYGPSATGCPPLEVQFYNKTIDANDFLWEFGDGNSSKLYEPLHAYYNPGSYKVKLTAKGAGGMSSESSVIIVVYDQPVALFDLAPRVTVLPGNPIVFTDRSIGQIVGWVWDFGDGNQSATQNPTHQYLESGTFNVSLEVENDKGCKSSHLLTEAVSASVGGKLKFPNAFTPSKTGSSGGVYRDRDPSNNIFFPFTAEGVMEYKLQIYTRWGELIFESKDLRIGWDGYFRDKLAQQGVYIYKAVVKYSNGSVETITGDVTLIR